MYSYVQELILTNLLKSASGLKYSELAPKEIGDNLFHYHLQFLIKKGVVEHSGGLYFLTTNGKSDVQHLDSQGIEKAYFKVGVLPYIVRSHTGTLQILMEKRLRHPYFGDVYPSISGKIQLGEEIEESAKARLKEKAGLICKPRFIGLFRKIRRDKKNKIFEDSFYHVCLGKDPEGVLEEKNVYGEHFWASFADAKNLLTQSSTSSTKSLELLDRVQSLNYDLFYFSEDITVDI